MYPLPPPSPSPAPSRARTPSLKGKGRSLVGKLDGWAGGRILHSSSSEGEKTDSEPSGSAGIRADFSLEINKAWRILRSFTVEGVETILDEENARTGRMSRVKVLRKIPPEILQSAWGIVILSSWGMGYSRLDFPGAGGVALAKLADGSWSAPSAVGPNSFQLTSGLGTYDTILVVRTPQALEALCCRSWTLGQEIPIDLGLYGSRAGDEAARSLAPVLSYTQSRGMHVGARIVGQILVDRTEEDAALYSSPGITSLSILAGRVRPPPQVRVLHDALWDAEVGRAQNLNGGGVDVIGSTVVEAHSSRAAVKAGRSALGTGRSVRFDVRGSVGLNVGRELREEMT